MKFRKLMLCLLASIIACGMFGIQTYAAEVTEQVTETTTTETTITETTETTETIEESDANLIEKEQEIKKPEETKEVTSTVKKPSTYKTTTKKKPTTKKVKYTKSELRLLSALISCEANGEPYAGKLAVGIVVVNRKESKLFPGTIKKVIYQKYQFGPARNGSLARALKKYDKGNFKSANEKACIKAAKAALSGTKKVTYKKKNINLKSYLYFSGRVKGARLKIAHHQFK